SSLDTWLRRITLRHLHRALRRHAAERWIQRAIAMVQSKVAESPQEEASIRESARRLYVALDGLTAEEQLLLHDGREFRGGSGVLAAAVGISPEAVRMRKMRLLKRLRASLAT